MAIHLFKNRYRMILATALRKLMANVKFYNTKRHFKKTKYFFHIEVSYKILNNSSEEETADGKIHEDIHQVGKTEGEEVYREMENAEGPEEVGACQLFQDL